MENSLNTNVLKLWDFLHDKVIDSIFSSRTGYLPDPTIITKIILTAAIKLKHSILQLLQTINYYSHIYFHQNQCQCFKTYFFTLDTHTRQQNKKITHSSNELHPFNDLNEVLTNKVIPLSNCWFLAALSSALRTAAGSCIRLMRS